MKRIGLSVASAAMLLATVGVGANASALENIISNPKVNLEIRPRYEYADIKSNGASAGKGLTVRTALGLKANLFDVEGLGTQVEMIDVSNFSWIDKYAPEQTGYDLIADPAQTRVTQANISYSFAGKGLTLLAGRKRVVLDDARFIGDVNWRQMPQSFDLYAGIYDGIPNLNLLAAYVTRVHKVTTANYSTSSVLLHASYKYRPELTITAFDYMIGSFADHIGLRLNGNIGLENGLKIGYLAEYAMQNDASIEHQNNGKPNQDADYYNISLTGSYNGFIVGAGYEVLGGSNKYKEFYTPLATLHKFNGWADVFLKGTGTNYGLTDFSVKLGYNAGAYGKLLGCYHKFDSDKMSFSYGKEFDLLYANKLTKNLGLLLKAAFYKGDDKVAVSTNPVLQNGYDVTKYWIQLDYKFSASL